MPSLKLGLFGWDLRKGADVPARVNADIVVFGQYPYNSYFMPRAALRVGATYYHELEQN